jgi:hypothetical protein
MRIDATYIIRDGKWERVMSWADPELIEEMLPRVHALWVSLLKESK